MRVSQRSIVLGISAEQVDQANRSWDSLESHEILGVVPYGLSIIHERSEKRVKEKKNHLSEIVIS